jgi:hypothetical protein
MVRYEMPPLTELERAIADLLARRHSQTWQSVEDVEPWALTAVIVGDAQAIAELVLRRLGSPLKGGDV